MAATTKSAKKPRASATKNKRATATKAKKAAKPKAKKGGRSKPATATETKEPSVKKTSARKPRVRTTIAEKTRAAILQYGGRPRPWVLSRMQTRPRMAIKDPVEMAKWVEWRKSVVLENVAYKSTGKIDWRATSDMFGNSNAADA
ncbi:hypothetical protein LTR73_003369 [Friedmanniomyces endolithicus]|nr:hypothetical protein LTR73_003369 [Friedmanniomyces endolithicus]